MSAIPTVKIKSKEHGFMWINECDLTDDMELYDETTTAVATVDYDAPDIELAVEPVIELQPKRRRSKT